MKRILLATTVIMPFTASMAFAQQFLNVDQTITATTQSATNTVSTSSNSETLEQGATNVANLVDQALGGGPVDQTVLGLVQEATNSATAGGRWRNVDQDSANLANILQGEDFGVVNQFILGLDQAASNSLVSGDSFSGGIDEDEIRRVTQSATNVGNLVNTEEDTAAITQLGNFAGQSAENVVSAGGMGDVRSITQGASNLMNIASMGEAAAIDQSILFSTQGASNEISQAQPGPFNSNTQDATNVGNLIDGGTIASAATQVVVGLPQTATNVMNISGAGGESVGFPFDNLDQGATNLANIVQLDELTQNLTQTSVGNTQSATNAIARTGGTTGDIRLADVTQTATNATNLVSAGTVGGGGNLVQFSGALTQTAGNSISGVTSVGIGGGPVIQGATNLGNVLTGND